MSEATHDLSAKYLVDPYLNWARAEGVPIVEGAMLDLLTLETKPWARFGVKGAICHVEGRCDFLSTFLFEIAPGHSSTSSKHLYEDCFYVLEGAGVTQINLSDGSHHEIAWAEGCAFTTPINATCIHRAEGASPARLVSFNDLRYLMGLYRNEDFLFHNSSPMSTRQTKAIEGALCVDLAAHEADAALRLGDSVLGATFTSLAPGAATQATRQMQGAHLLGVMGEGTTVSLLSKDAERITTHWRRGCLTGLTGMEFHQHRNISNAPVAFLKVEFGSQATPLFRSRRAAYGDTEVYASGNAVLATI